MENARPNTAASHVTNTRRKAKKIDPPLPAIHDRSWLHVPYGKTLSCKSRNGLVQIAHLNHSGSAWSRPDLAARPGPGSFPASRAQTSAICAVLEASMLPAVLFSSFVIAQTAVFPGIILEVLQAILYIDPHCSCQRCAKHPHTRNKGDTRL